MTPKQLLALTLETLLNQAIQFDPVSLHLLTKLAGKTIHVELRGLNLDFFIFPSSEGLTIQSESDKNADVTLSGAPFSLMTLFFDKNALPAAHPDILIQGDIGVIHQLADILRSLHIDWEEQLSRILGDVSAHKINYLFNQTQEYAQDRLRTLHANCSEYLQEEIRLLPTATEIIYFMNQIDHLRDDIERLEKRLQRLQLRQNSH
jgi:ubiquinone biosynthesis protein UbiJ